MFVCVVLCVCRERKAKSMSRYSHIIPKCKVCNVPRDLVTAVKRPHKTWNVPRPHSHLSLQST